MQQQLTGAEVDVHCEGELYIKPRFMGAKRPRYVSLTGTTLQVGVSEDAPSPHEYSIDRAKMQSRRAQLRIVLILPTKEKLTYYAVNSSEFTRWVAAFTDSIQWKVQRFYELGNSLGSGAFSIVVKGVHRTTNMDVAVKIINKANCSEEDVKYLQREIDIARSLNHEYVTTTIECFESDKNLYIVCEYMAGGTLEEMINRLGRVSETNAKLIMANIFEAVDHIHTNGIVHRDMKPENLLCTRAELPTVVKLTDFGLARRTQCDTQSGMQVEDDDLVRDGMMTTPVGTPKFVAPEVLHGLPYGKEVDLFSCGVIMYYLLSGRYPFQHNDHQKLVDLIKRAEYSYPDREWRVISPEAKDLIDSLLDRSPYTRATAKSALRHKWSAGLMRTASEIPNPSSVLRRATTQGRCISDMSAAGCFVHGRLNADTDPTAIPRKSKSRHTHHARSPTSIGGGGGNTLS
jgi:calcium/calmodulin-dependent protein kinase I